MKQEERDTDNPRIYVLQNPNGTSPELEQEVTTKFGTKVIEMSDGGYETQDGNYTYYWWIEIENNQNWKRLK